MGNLLIGGVAVRLAIVLTSICPLCLVPTALFCTAALPLLFTVCSRKDFVEKRGDYFSRVLSFHLCSGDIFQASCDFLSIRPSVFCVQRSYCSSRCRTLKTRIWRLLLHWATMRWILIHTITITITISITIASPSSNISTSDLPFILVATPLRQLPVHNIYDHCDFWTSRAGQSLESLRMHWQCATSMVRCTHIQCVGMPSDTRPPAKQKLFTETLEKILKTAKCFLNNE